MTIRSVFIFALDEQEAAAMLGLSIDTVRKWRRDDTIPDYLYRRFGKDSQLRIRYCQVLLLRWQAADSTDRLAEEIWARAEIEKSLMVK